MVDDDSSHKSLHTALYKLKVSVPAILALYLFDIGFYFGIKVDTSSLETLFEKHYLKKFFFLMWPQDRPQCPRKFQKILVLGEPLNASLPGEIKQVSQFSVFG